MESHKNRKFEIGKTLNMKKPDKQLPFIQRIGRSYRNFSPLEKNSYLNTILPNELFVKTPNPDLKKLLFMPFSEMKGEALIPFPGKGKAIMIHYISTIEKNISGVYYQIIKIKKKPKP